MVSTVFAAAAVLLLAQNVAASSTYAKSDMTTCLSMCITNSTNPCNTSSLPAFISCLNRECAAQNSTAIAEYSVNFQPRVEYSCGLSPIPAYDTPSTNLSLTGLGNCITSPYSFQSFEAAHGDQYSIVELCRIKLFEEPNCEGAAKVINLSSFDRCFLEAGKSAKLDCGSTLDSEVALQHVQHMCSNATAVSESSTSATSSSTTLPFPTGSFTVSLNVTSRPSATLASSRISTASSSPFRGEAYERQGANPSFAALVVVFAALTIL